MRRPLTIGQRLIGLIVLSMVAVVGALAIYFTSNQIREITDNLHRKAATYSQLVAKQASSAVAFSDRETAREVLSSIASDTDIASVMLYGDDGAPLFSHGTASPAVGASTPAGTYNVGARLIAITPVTSLEGPRGTLVLELATSRIAAARRTLTLTAVATGGFALIVSILVVWLIVRGVARRLRAIANVATAVAGGDLSQQPVDDARRDEIGIMASAFNAMLTQIKGLIDRVREMAREEQQRLEKLVAERTAALDARNAEMRLVFDQVDQGLLVVDLDGTIANERSAAVERWLGPVPHGIAELVAGFAPERFDWQAMWSMVVDDIMPREVSVAQLPTRFSVGGRELDWAYKLFEATNGATRILVVITDVTAEVERQRAERDQREIASLTSRLIRDRRAALTWSEEASRLIAEIDASVADPATYLRAVHTLKGLSGMLELTSVAAECHALESAYAAAETTLVAKHHAAIGERWRFLAGHIAPMLHAAVGRIELFDREVERLEAAIEGGAPHGELARMVTSWRHDRAADRLEQLAEQARATALRLCRSSLEVRVEADPDLRLPSSWAPLWSTLGHAIRNAIDHGIEDADERLAAGKTAAGTLTLSVRQEDFATIAIEISDDGRGIAWERVAELARERGLPAETRADLERALFKDGFSTRDNVTETSGRGVGMAALLSACESTGGRVAIASSSGIGTTFRFTWSTRRRTRSIPLQTISLA